ncbi:unnamed protein product [Ilex paraguariensis]|uniref:Uncharacterized protein n=1 Tax=Ilex paraguariensis TaxID=185542 RepID=A0ABC8R9B8_9AQUA
MGRVEALLGAVGGAIGLGNVGGPTYVLRREKSYQKHENRLLELPIHNLRVNVVLIVKLILLNLIRRLSQLSTIRHFSATRFHEVRIITSWSITLTARRASPHRFSGVRILQT